MIKQLKNFLKVSLIVLIITFFFTIAFYNDGKNKFFINYLYSAIIGLVCCFICFWGGFLLLQLRHKIFPKPIKENDINFTYIESILLLPFGIYSGYAISSNVMRQLGMQWNSPNFLHYKQGLLIGLFCIAISLTIFFRQYWRDEKEQLEDEKRILENRMLHAHITALTLQMNPHLLFNSLNTIASLIHSYPNQAEDMTVLLSELYRRVLEASKKEQHSLEHELSLCRAYLEVEKVRIGNRLTYIIEENMDNEGWNLLLPVMIIQPFIENAIRHGIMPKAAGGKLIIRLQKNETNLVIDVIDNGVGLRIKKVAQIGSGIAIENCRERLYLFYGTLASLTLNDHVPHGTHVHMSIPIKKINEGSKECQS